MDTENMNNVEDTETQEVKTYTQDEVNQMLQKRVTAG